MRGWSIFLSCVYLRCKWWAKRPLELFLLVALVPLTMLLIITITGSVFSHDGLPIAIVDEDQSEFSELVIERLSNQPMIYLQQVDHEAAIRLVHTNKVEAAIFFHEDFMDNILNQQRSETIQLLYPPSSITESIISELVSIEVLRLSSNVRAAQFVSDKYEQHGLVNKDKQQELWQEAWDHSDSYWEPEPLMSINYIERNEVSGSEGSKDLTLVYYQLHVLIGYLSAIIVILSVFVQQWFVEEKELGITKRLKSTTVSPFIYVLGHSLPAFVFIFAQGILAIVLIFGAYEFIVSVTVEVILLYTAYLFAIFLGSLFLAISVKTSAQLQGIGIFIAIFTSFIGGSFIDLGELIQRARWLSNATPQGWFLTSLKEVLPIAHEGQSFLLMMPAITSLLGFSLLFSFLCIGGWKKL